MKMAFVDEDVGKESEKRKEMMTVETFQFILTSSSINDDDDE